MILDPSIDFFAKQIKFYSISILALIEPAMKFGTGISDGKYLLVLIL